MRKLFLLGTMLGVASAALAFGGVFGGGGHGSKSTTYKGGVDAIGVHFGGEKKGSISPKPEEHNCSEQGTWNTETSKCACDFGYTGTDCSCAAPYVFNESTNTCECPDEKQCGEVCCGGDNVCHQDTETGEFQCCNPTYNECCPANQTATRSYGPPYVVFECCTGVAYCWRVGPDGECLDDYYYCCANGEPFKMGHFSYGDAYTCCPGTLYKGAKSDGSDLCCYSKTEKSYCYNRDSSGKCTDTRCCSGTISQGTGTNGADECLE